MQHNAFQKAQKNWHIHW